MVISNDVTITEHETGAITYDDGEVKFSGLTSAVIPARVVAALRAHFAAERDGDYFEGLEEGIKVGRAERMPEDVQELVERVKERVDDVMQGNQTGNPDSIFNLTTQLVAALEAAYSQNGAVDDSR